MARQLPYYRDASAPTAPLHVFGKEAQAEYHLAFADARSLFASS